ncbi:MAG: lauroyl acyltransferase [Rhodospirillales bacterium]|nr:lauroyl acyltransferase [Rhodospirillales bacterium]
MAAIGDWWRAYVLRPVRGWGMIGLMETMRAFPLRAATDGVAAVARRLGPHFGVSNVARRNLDRAFPDLAKDRREAILVAMWDNLSRTVCEYAHLKTIVDDAGSRVEIVGGEHLDALAADGKPGIVFSAHLASWEMVTLAARLRGVPDLHVVYRNANNLILDEYIRKLQSVSGVTLIRKGIRGARKLLQVMQGGGHVIMLVDQKMNEGIAVPFFGRPAMTAPALAQLALRFQCPVVPAHVERLGDTRFRVVIEPPLPLPDSGNREADVLALMTEVNLKMEGWIRARPEQWLWLHRRWPKEDA